MRIKGRTSHARSCLRPALFHFMKSSDNCLAYLCVMVVYLYMRGRLMADRAFAFDPRAIDGLAKDSEVPKTQRDT